VRAAATIYLLTALAVLAFVIFLLVRDGFSQLVYKHAISTLMPSSPLKLFDG